jgi:Translation elongation factor EF-1alpha (GTPase)
VPCSGLTGENLTTPSQVPALTSWYSGPCLLDVIGKITRTPLFMEVLFACYLTL